MRFGHPSRRSLRDWLLGEDDAKVEAHVATCEQCAVAIEVIEAEETDSAIGDALARVLAPPPDFAERLHQRVNQRLDSRQVFGVVADLFGAGFETSKLLMSEDYNDNN